MLCSKCKTDYPIDNFYRDRSKPSGYHSICKSCHKKNCIKLLESNPDIRKKRNLISKLWRENNPERSRYLITTATLKSKYGISLEDYNLLLAKQNGCCAVCGSLPTQQRLHVDHNHVTGEIRGLLCQACNVSIGKMKESPELLRKLALYIERK